MSEEPNIVTPKEPGIFSVIGNIIRKSAALSIVGAAVAAAVTGGAAFFGEAGAIAQTVSGFSGGLLNFGTSAAAAAGMAGVMGAAGGALLGVPVGSVTGVNQIRSYYKDVAIPMAQQQAAVQGMQYGAALEQQAAAHEKESQRIHEYVGTHPADQQKGSFVAREEQRRANLAEMEPQGRA